ncbi:MAG: putative CocE/NonD family hydrolase [Parasphingorhabdus sp.]|jgi:putative CocE/NonD family hydrolase
MVNHINHLWIPMSDGSRLGARLWLPDVVEDQTVPAILEYIPYRKDDSSAIRDSTTIAWFASKGYACLRVDMRGSGSSDGVMVDEYSDQEIDDGVEVVNWMEKQDWCNGNVGMIGISWGGITGMQVAQRQPEALKTIIVLGASEFRYYDDAAYYMGCMTGQTIGWGAIMFGFNTRPPDPELAGENWRALWLERLNNTPHYMEHWFSHQREDEYWLRGSVGTDYDAIKIPVYAVSGHADCWPNTVARLLKNLSVPTRGLQGAWCHRYPHLAIPGPAIGFLDDAARWFDQWLKQQDTGITKEAKYQVYLQDSVRPQPFYETRPGRWVGEPSWPSPNVEDKVLFLDGGSLVSSEAATQDVSISSPQDVGLKSGEYMPWFAFGKADELPDDQQEEDANSVVFDYSVTTQPLQILGNPRVQVHFKCDQPQALLACRLCDVWPDGASTLITRGLINLSQRNSKRNPQSLTPGEIYTAEIELNHVGYVVPPGHKLRLAISTSYWPIAWPSPTATIVNLTTGKNNLRLPLRSMEADSGELTDFKPTETGTPINTTQLRDIKQTRTITTDPESGCRVWQINADNGQVRFEDSQLQMASSNLQRYTIHPEDPLSAKAEYEWEWEYSRGDEWQTRTFTRTEITCDQHFFFLKAESKAWENDEMIFSKSWDKKYPRDHF